jgi:hypothetical protein
MTIVGFPQEFADDQIEYCLSEVPIIEQQDYFFTM